MISETLGLKSNGVEVAMLADDVSLFCSHPCKVTAQAALQEAVISVAEWSRHHKMTLNTDGTSLDHAITLTFGLIPLITQFR